MYHAIFLLDYVGFRQEVEPFVRLADKGEYAAIIDKATEIAVRIAPEEWILEDLGTSLKGFSDEAQESRSTPQTIGFSFLVLLSQFLKPVPFPAPGLGNVAQAVTLLNWDRKDVDLLRNGMATTTLLKPDLVENPLERPPSDDPRWHKESHYWWWLRPEYAFYTGWWEVRQLEKLRNILSKTQPKLAQVDVAQLNLHPSVTNKVLHENYERTIQLFDLAVSQQVGLYSITR